MTEIEADIERDVENEGETTEYVRTTPHACMDNTRRADPAVQPLTPPGRHCLATTAAVSAERTLLLVV